MKVAAMVAMSLAVLASAQASLYDLTAVDTDGNAVDMSLYAGNVSVVINVATF